jgi:hypothetical protein
MHVVNHPIRRDRLLGNAARVELAAASSIPGSILAFHPVVLDTPMEMAG